ncbi:GDP-4-dehydro-6-deoxy-D-mannose reductase [Humitalea rosea]|uniref:GDP-4-dehydro-6-deoxy-D-mannose reductase n=1 Tax=Humitalea rosea TaxID=990373 RepID=A0A2W7J475_9PROT|nr:NAD-dependent epimerase/dehydratase family protein [Humitalea rosea]PZW45873.1 GDP-4-dehydro-6-deoxy-D-mannose reductase [Humitalea rosea]
MSARILITGADGFVGRHLLPVLREAFPQSRLIAASRSGRVPVGADAAIVADLLEPDSWRPAVREAAPTAVLHLAAQASVPVSFADPAGTWKINLGGTLALAEAVMAEAPDALFIYVSTVEVYGLSFQSGLPLDETALPRPANPYAASKAAADLAVGEMALRGLRAIRLRPANHTGAGQSSAYAVPAFARQAARIAAGVQPPRLQVGALDRWRDFLDVQDVCAAYAATIARGDALAPGTVLNLASGSLRRIGDVLDDLLRLAGVSPEIEEAANRLRSTDVVRAVPDASAARAALGWAPAVPWETTLGNVLADWRGRLDED